MYRILNGNGDVLYESESAIALREYARRNIVEHHDWRIEWSTPALGWMACKPTSFAAQCQREQRAKILARLRA